MAASKLSITERCFFVTALCDIGDKFQEGDQVLIDPDRKPEPHNWVLVEDGKSLEPWQGREHFGVAIGHFTDEEACHGR